MKIEHKLVGFNEDDILVMYNPDMKYKLREYIYPSEGHFNLMSMYYDGVSGETWTRITLQAYMLYSEFPTFMIGLNRHHQEFSKWDDKTFIIPEQNTEIYEVKREVSYENDMKIQEWDVNKSKWWLEWHKTSIKTPLTEYVGMY